MRIIYVSKGDIVTMLYNKNAKKKPTNLTINSELLQKAKSHNINLSQCLEASLEKELKKIEQTLWERENQEAIDSYNKRVEKNGVFSEGLRAF